jgi:uncharacterized protein involved in exopolysaccharide biosynthesis
MPNSRPLSEIVGMLLMSGLAVWTGSYLIFKPQQYKDELATFENIISRFPRWAVRILGVFVIVVAITVSYLFLTTPK